MRDVRPFFTAALAIGGLLAAGCAPVGLLYHDVKAPPARAHLNQSGGDRVTVKTGESCAHGVLELVAWGDASQKAAAAAGGITTVHTADVHRISVLGIVYRRFCLRVSGE